MLSWQGEVFQKGDFITPEAVLARRAAGEVVS
jgi:hypothetical protein